MAATIADLIASLKAIPDEYRRALPRAHAAVFTVIKRDLEAGRAPDGTPWAPTKDGKRALPNAAAELVGDVLGDVLYFAIPFPYRFHQVGRTAGQSTNRKRGLVTGMPARIVMPEAITPRIKAAIVGQLVEGLNRAMRKVGARVG